MSAGSSRRAWRSTAAALASVLVLAPAAAGTQSAPATDADPVGIWNMTIRVGHIGEGIRPVLLEVSRGADGLEATISGMQGRMNPVDEFSFEDGTMHAWVGSYEYVLKVQGDTVEGTVTSQTGSQDVTGTRQQTRIFAGDEPPLLEKDWQGVLASRACAEQPPDDVAGCTTAASPTAADLVLRTRREVFPFENAAEFSESLTRLAGERVTIHGWWVVDKIRIQTVEKAEPPARRR